MVFDLRAVASAMGPLRLLLAGIALILIVFPTPPNTAVGYEGTALLRSLVAPVLAPIVLMGLLLDLMMARVWLSGLEDSARGALQTVSLVDLTLSVLLTLMWLPFFLSLGRL